MQGKVFVDAAQTSDEMVFEGADGAFSSIAAMHAGGDKLVVNGFRREKLFEGGGTFVVQTVKLGPEASRNQTCMQFVKGSKNARAGATAHWLNQNAIAVVVVQHEDIVVADT
jgi:hypothetical protein